MYCVNGESGSSLLIESTDSMIQKALAFVLRLLQHEKHLHWITCCKSGIMNTAACHVCLFAAMYCHENVVVKKTWKRRPKE